MSTERKKLDEQCLKLWSKCIRTNQKVCRNCGKDINLQAHHIVQRTYKLSRYNLKNGLCLCSSCHFWEKVDPEKFRNIVTGIIGEDKYLELQDKYRCQWKWTVDDLKNIKAELQQKLKSLEED